MAAQQRTAGMIPDPDPTQLTTEAVDRAKAEINHILELEMRIMRTELEGDRKLTAEKFTARDSALDAALKFAQDLGQQQNSSNAAAINKSELSTAKQLDSVNEKIDDLKQSVALLSERNWAGGWATAAGYIGGAVGIIALIATMFIK